MQHTSSLRAHLAAAPPDRTWDHFQSGDNWRPVAGPLLVVGPHPHDEILGAGGLIHTWVSWGHDVTVLSVTDGEADTARDEHLDLMRRDELRCALRKLSATHVSVVRMGLRDGHVNESRNRLRMALDALLEPHMTVVAPVEHDGHPDNDAVGRVCRESALSNGVALARYLVRPWGADVAEPKGVNWGRFPLDMEARRAKAHALQCFNSQRASNHPAKFDPCQRSFEAFLV